MKIVSVINPKGGAGKTPVSIHVAYHLSQHLNNVAALDTDGQRGTALFADTRRANYPNHTFPHVYELNGSTSLTDTLMDIAGQGVEVLVVDTPAGFAHNHIELITVSDLIIMPMAPGGMGFAASQPAIEGMMAMLQEGRTNAVMGIIPTRFSKQQKLSRELVKMIEDSGFPLFDRALPESTYYSNAIDQGLTLFELSKLSSPSERVKIDNPAFPLKMFLKDVLEIVNGVEE